MNTICTKHLIYSLLLKTPEMQKQEKKKKSQHIIARHGDNPCGKVSYSPATTRRALLEDEASALNDSVRPSSLTVFSHKSRPGSKANSPEHSQTRDFNFPKNRAIGRVEHNFPLQENSIRRQ